LSSPATPSPFRLREFGAAYLLGAGHGASHWITGTFFLLLPKIREEFGFSYAAISLIGTVYYAGSLATNLVSGPVVDISGRRIVFQVIALFLVGLAMVGLGFTGNIALIAVMALLIASANNLWHPAAMSFLSSEYPANRAFVLSIHGVGSNVGEAVGPLAAGFMLSTLAFGWQKTAIASAIPALTMAVVTLLVLLPKDRPIGAGAARRGVDARTYMRGMWMLLRERAMLGLTIMAGFRSMAQSGLKFFLPFYIVDVLNLPYVYAGFAMTALLLGGMIAAPIAGMYSDRVGRRAVIMVSLCVSSVIIVLLTAIGDGKTFVFGIALLGFTMLAIRPVIQGWLMDIVPHSLAGSAISVMFSVQSVKSAITPALGGLVAEIYGLTAVFYMLAGILLLANLVVFILPRHAAEPTGTAP